jgi:hypothetical protein
MTAETEAGFMEVVISYAHLRGWRVAHFRPAMTAHGWRTPVQADGKGWPDLVLVRPPRMVASELKRDVKTEAARARQLTPDQARWLADLAGAGVETFCWRPADWPAVQETLR